jgi:integrase
LPAIEATVRPNTLLSYRLHVESYIIPRLGGLRLQAVTPAGLNAFYNRLLVDGRIKTLKGLTPTTVRRIHATLHRALRDATKWHRVTRNPADDADPPRESTASAGIVWWTAGRLGAFLRSVADDRLRSLWVLAATTGMRRGELLGLRWSDVDLDQAGLSVRQTLVSVGYKVQISEPKTDKGRRHVALDGFSVDALMRARYRHSLAVPELLSPDEVCEVTVDLSVTSNVFLPGHRIRLEVSSSNFPRFDRNTNTGGTITEDSDEDVQVAVNRIFHGPGHPSRLVLPVIDR